MVSLNGVCLKNVKEFKYLGSYIRIDEPSTGDTELNHRIQMSAVKFAQLAKLLLNFKIHLKTRIKFFNSFIRSRLVYSCQNWTLTSSQYDRLDVSYRTFLRRMVRGGFRRISDENGESRYRISNAKLHSICGTSDVSNFVKSQQCSYAAHVIRMPTERSIKKLMFNDDKYSKPGRSFMSLLEQVCSISNKTVDGFCNEAMSKKLGKSG